MLQMPVLGPDKRKPPALQPKRMQRADRVANEASIDGRKNRDINHSPPKEGLIKLNIAFASVSPKLNPERISSKARFNYYE